MQGCIKCLQCLANVYFKRRLRHCRFTCLGTWENLNCIVGEFQPLEKSARKEAFLGLFLHCPYLLLTSSLLLTRVVMARENS